jgi:uncharacterized integral membrane protein (TIGR00698 family)
MEYPMSNALVCLSSENREGAKTRRQTRSKQEIGRNTGRLRSTLRGTLFSRFFASVFATSRLRGSVRATQASRLLFPVAAAMCLLPWASPPIALAAGACLALMLGNPWPAATRSLTPRLLQTCVVMLGFGMDLPVVLRAGAAGTAMAAGTIVMTFVAGAFLGRWLQINRTSATLISAGTAICGGSAIAAVGSVIGAAEGEMTVAMGTVFVLNAAALVLFPPIGHWLHLSQTQFGTWAGVAIHDISSVVGAASRYGLPALQTATAVKLSRALWIIPVAAAAAARFGQHEDGEDRQRKPMKIPWFIGLFLLASIARSVFPAVANVAPTLSHLATIGLTLTLFLVGAGLSRATLQKVGCKPLLQGVLLWILVSAVSLVVIVARHG